MSIENLVCSAELAQELKKLGINQDSLCYWIKYPTTVHMKTNPDGTIFEDETGSTVVDRIEYEMRIGSPLAWNIPKDDTWSAFTSAELGLILPTWINEMSLTCFQCSRDGWWTEYNDGRGRKSDFTVWAKNEADSRAKMLIYLIENGLMEVPK